MRLASLLVPRPACKPVRESLHRESSARTRGGAEPVAVDGGETDHVCGVLHPQTGAAEGVAVFISAVRCVRTRGGNGGETDHA